MSIDKRLETVRKLLATAEHPNTPPSEAESAAAMAEKLIAKYAIDVALVQARGEVKVTPTTRNINIDNPYVTPKAAMLNAIGHTHNVRVVMVARTDGSKFCTMVGFTSDLDVVEMLYTSLLLQATSAMLAQPNTGRAFRRSFLLGYASVVAERLEAAKRTAAAEAEPGSALVLRDRSADVDAAMRKTFPNVRSSRLSHGDPHGARRGAHAGANANLNGSSTLGGGRRSVTA